jgi:ribosome-associated protein
VGSFPEAKSATKGGHPLEAIKVAQRAVEAASEKKATDIVLLDARGVCSFADYFVLCSGESSKQIEAIRDEIGHVLKKEGILPHHYEGTVDSGWLLIDLSDVIVHIFAPLEREHYQLDQLWSQAVPIVRIQ